MTPTKPIKILSQFNIPVEEYSCVLVKNGLINLSYYVVKATTNTPIYFLQRINQSIFKDVAGVMHNIDKVCTHMEKLEYPIAHLELIHTKKKQPFYKAENGACWRMYKYISGTTYFKAGNLKLASESGRAYGTFLSSLSKLNPKELAVTIPHFHDISLRIKQFEETLITATDKKIKKAKPWIELINDNKKDQISIFKNIVKTCPLRITHNDTKLSNLLFDTNQKAKCVIDYDTIMPGYLSLDFGDAVRTICSTTNEDDKKIEHTKYDLKLVNAFSSSFTKALQSVLTQPEIELLPNAAIYMPFLMGLRMLTDYLNNDIYYSTNYPEHNYDRAANQLTLYKTAQQQFPEMTKVIN